MERPAYLLEFEKPLRELEKQLEALHQQSLENNIDMSAELATIEAKIEATRQDIYTHLTPWQRVQVARHPRRPYALDFIQSLFMTNGQPLQSPEPWPFQTAGPRARPCLRGGQRLMGDRSTGSAARGEERCQLRRSRITTSTRETTVPAGGLGKPAICNWSLGASVSSALSSQ